MSVTRLVKIGEHNIETQGFNKDQVFGIKSDRNDGVHFNGINGKDAYAESIKNIFKVHGISRSKLNL